MPSPLASEKRDQEGIRGCKGRKKHRRCGIGAASGGTATAKNAGKAAKETKNAIEKVGEFVAEHKGVLLIGGGILLIIMLISGMLGSCSVMFNGGSDVVIETSYTAEDSDILSVEGQTTLRWKPLCRQGLITSGLSIPAMTSTTSHRTRSATTPMSWHRI